MKQLALSFANTPIFTRERYVVGACNRDAYQWLETYPTWPEGTLGVLILGAPHSGKTHLCHAFLEKNPAARFLNGHVCSANHPFDFNEFLFVLDDADMAPEPWLFHFFNHTKDKGARFVMTVSESCQYWCRLPDLSSRLTTLPVAMLDLPDDALMLALLKKNLTDCGVFVDDSVLIYLVQHIDRSYAAVQHWVMLLERLSAEQKRNITIAFIRKVLNETVS